MQPTNTLYETHLHILDRAAFLLLRDSGDEVWHVRGRTQDFDQDDLIQIGAEKWIAIVSAWPGQDGTDLRKLIYRACRNVMINHMSTQGRHVRRRAPQEDGEEVEDEAQEVGISRVEMAIVHTLPGQARALVLQALGLVEGPAGTFRGNGKSPRARVSMATLSRAERKRAKENIAAALTA